MIKNKFYIFYNWYLSFDKFLFKMGCTDSKEPELKEIKDPN